MANKDEKKVVEAKEATVVKAAVAMPLRGKKELVASLGEDADWTKLLVQGLTGSGKTFLIVGALLRGLRVFVASTDIGGNGLKSVRDEMQRLGKLDLYNSNLAVFEFKSYEDFAAFTTNPDVVKVAGKKLWDWDPDLFVWDGLSNFQESHIWRYVMSLDPLSNDATESREEGVQAGLVEWGQIRKCTTLQIDQFLQCHSPKGKLIHKLVTVLLDDGKEDKFTHQVAKGPLILGAARSYIGPAFDYILTTVTAVKPGSDAPAFKWKCDIGSNTVAKRRGQGVPKEILERADTEALWGFLLNNEKEKK